MKLKAGQIVLATLAGIEQKVIISNGYRSNQKQICVQPFNKDFKGQLSFTPYAYLTQNELTLTK